MMKRISVISLLWLMIMHLSCNSSEWDDSQTIARIKVSAGDHVRFDTPLSLDLDRITSEHESSLRLFEVTGAGSDEVYVQFSSGRQRLMHWMMEGQTEQGETRYYELKKEAKSIEYNHVRVERITDAFVLFSGIKPALQYNSGIVYPPDGIDQAYSRSGFIHPLYAPNGAILTAIQPPDHLHHYGLWNPWTKTTFRGEEVDFWNLGKKEGTVKFAGVVSINEGPVFASLQVLHEHVAWPGSVRETRAINEMVEITVFKRLDGKFLIEYSSSLSPVEEIILEQYRYGGFVLRATEEWTNETSTFVTSRGLNRDQADGERAEWCIVSGDTPLGEAGILMMGHPANYNHPEPLRVWPSGANRGRGDVFINFSPTRNTRWVLEPGKTYLLRYRMLVFQGILDNDTAERTWNDYAVQPEISVEKPGSRFPDKLQGKD